MLSTKHAIEQPVLGCICKTFYKHAFLLS
jgi:hypothetical protein